MVVPGTVEYSVVPARVKPGTVVPGTVVPGRVSVRVDVYVMEYSPGGSPEVGTEMGGKLLD